MSFILRLAIAALWPLAVACEEVSLCVQSLNCQVLPGLTEAVEAAAALQGAEITFQRKTSCEWPLDAAELPPQTELQVSNTAILVRDKVLIRANSTLELLSIDLRVQANGELAVEGLLKLFDVRIQRSEHSAIVAQGGVIDVHSSTIQNNSAVISITSGAEITVRNSTFASNSGLLIEGVSAATGSVSVDLSGCVFEENGGTSLVQITRSSLGQPVSIAVTECSFRHNSARLFDLYVRGLAVTIQSSAFSHNSASGLRLSDSTASVLISGTRWTNNGNSFVWVVGEFSGTVLISNSTLSFQSTAAALYIENKGPALSCLFAVSSVEMSDFYIDSPVGVVGAIYSQYCVISVSDTAIKNCTNNASVLASGIGLMFIAAGSVAMRNVSIADCGGSGMLIAIMLSSAIFDTVKIADAVVGSDGVIVAVASFLEVPNIEFNGGDVYGRQPRAANRLSLLYIEMSALSAGNITVTWLTKSIGGAVVGGYASTISCEWLRVANSAGNVAVSQAKSDIRIAHLDCDLCHFVCLGTSAGHCTMEYSHLHVTRSFFSNSLFCFGSGANLSLSHAFLNNSQAGGLVTAYSTVVTVTDVVIIDCQFALLLKDMVLSQASLLRVEARGMEGGILSASSSDFQLTACRFTGLRGRDVSISLSTSTLTMHDSVLAAASSRLLVRVLKRSKLSLHGCAFAAIRTHELVLIEVVDSGFVAADSSFSDFNATLISSLRSPTTLVDSTIENGGPGYITGSLYLSDYGGVLHCVDCPSINITRVSIRHTSADLGGALFISSETASTLTIASSEFVRCRANSGGVAVLRNVSFTIEDSTFLNSSAEAAGGALDISIQPEHFRTIELCTFKGNSAHEGGAVKWRSAQPHFAATQFYNNSAAYGPDIASYGAHIADYATDCVVAPGQRTSMSFVLLDHYGARVTTANHRLLVLNGVEEVSIKGISHKAAQAGIFNFSELEFFAPPNSNQSIIALYNETSVDHSVALEYLRTVSFRDCEVGEIARNTSCEVCAQGYYSLRPDAPNCSLCPSHAHCPGGNRIVLKPDSWLTSDPDNPVMGCLVEGRCDGAEENACTEGHAGLLCGHCADGWFPLVFSTCQRCPHMALVWVELALAVAIRAVAVSAFIRLTARPPDEGQLHALKTLILHAQSIALLSYVQMNVPVEIAVFLHLTLSAVSMYTANFPFRCFGRSYKYNAGTASLETPITLSLILLYFLYTQITKRQSALTKHNIASALVLWSHLQSGVALMAVLPSLICVSVDSSSEWLAIDMAQQCWSDDHLHFIAYTAAPSLALNVVLPVLLLLVARRHLAHFSESMHPGWDVFLRSSKYACVYCVVAQAANSQSSQLFVGLLFLYLDVLLNSVAVQYRNPKSLCLLQWSGFVQIASFSLMLHFPEDFVYRVLASVAFVLINAGLMASAVIAALRGFRPSPSQEDPHPGRQERSMDSLVPPNNSVVSEKGVHISIEESKVELG